MNTNLSVIILSYNTKNLTKRCILALIKSLPKNKDFVSEIIVVDNGSNDGSVEKLKAQSRLNRDKNKNLRFKLILNKNNLGYPKGNNQGLKIAHGKYILFLNSDVIIDRIDFEELIVYLDNHPKTGVLTVEVILPNGNIDPASHRGFPTIWNSFCYFIGLEELLRNLPFANKIFGGYHLVHLNLAKTHEIDSVSGAFYLSRVDILIKAGGFDESFFMYGEDIDLSFRLKKLNYKIVYYPKFKVNHLKYASGLEKNDIVTRKKTRYHFFDAMEIFYRKHYEKSYPTIVNEAIYFLFGIAKNIYVQNRN